MLVARDARVGIVLMNRPKQLNALSGELMGAVIGALEELDADPEIRAIVLGGGERAFAAGADITELAAGTSISLYENRRIEQWDRIRDLRTPVVAAVSGFCLGGGCELAMLCDLIVASETAKFGQPEINLGVLPGAGGTQRLTRAVGKAIAMDMILTGRMISAREALGLGLVARVVAKEAWLDEAKRAAAEIAAKGPIAVRLAKEAVDQAFEVPLSAGVEFERRAFYLARASEDATEGLTAFVEKRGDHPSLDAGEARNLGLVLNEHRLTPLQSLAIHRVGRNLAVPNLLEAAPNSLCPDRETVIAMG